MVETLSEEGGGDDGEMKTPGESSNQDEEGKEIDYSPSAPPYFTVRRPHKSSDGGSSGPAAETSLLASYQQLHGDDADAIPSAPPMEVFDSVAGYEALSFDTAGFIWAIVSCPPPSQYGDFEWLDSSEPMLSSWTVPGPDCTIVHTIPQLTEAMARTALLGYVKHHCCWGASAAKHMTINTFRPMTAFHYVLHTFTEKREARWAWSPHIGGDIDGPDLGTPPSPWEISASPTKPFVSEIRHLEVPHTATVKPCHRCKGVGTLACSNCHGKGWTRCLACHGEGFGVGTDSRERCIMCGTMSHGHGRQECTRCSAKGRITCSICDAYGQLKCYIQVTVSWKVVTGEHVVGGENLPPDLIRQVEGQVGLEETGIRLSPLPVDIIPDETLAMASAQLIQEHLENSSDSLILAQRHQVRIVPVTSVGYQWKGHVGSYYIYGLEKRVFTSDYPQTCCCGCNIL